MIVIYDTLGAYGGSHTLMLRMGEWLKCKKIKMVIICTSDSNKEIVGKLKENNVQIIPASLSNAKIGQKIIKELLEIEPIKVYCFAWNHYLDVERIKKKYKLSFDNFVYCIHPETFKKGIGFKTKLMRGYAIENYRKILKRMNDNNALIFMDEVDINESESYFDCILDGEMPIIRLPMFCPERPDAENIIRRGYKSNVLLTAARADFPYKGYLIGLIDLFVKQKKNYPDMELEIVASGDDIGELKEKISRQNDEIKSAITLHGWMEYEELKQIMQNCRAFIGMGTGVLDAALQYKPAIVVLFNTMDCISDHFISEKPTYSTVSSGCTESAESRIVQVFGWNFQEYREQCFLSFERTKEVYDIEQCMDRLINMETKSKESLLNSCECVRHVLNQKINEIRFHNISASNFKNLEWEKK